MAFGAELPVPGWQKCPATPEQLLSIEQCSWKRKLLKKPHIFIRWGLCSVLVTHFTSPFLLVLAATPFAACLWLVMSLLKAQHPFYPEQLNRAVPCPRWETQTGLWIVFGVICQRSSACSPEWSGAAWGARYEYLNRPIRLHRFTKLSSSLSISTFTWRFWIVNQEFLLRFSESASCCNETSHFNLHKSSCLCLNIPRKL